MSDVVLVAIIAACVTVAGTVVSPVILARITNRERRREREADYARQDEIAARAGRVATQAAEQAAEVARRLLEDNKRVAQVQTSIQTQLTGIHTLVNDNLSQAIANERDARVEQRKVLLELIELQRRSGLQTAPETSAALRALQDRISELDSILTDRARQVAIVDSSI